MKPPASVPILSLIIDDTALPDAVFRSYCRLLSKAWRHNYQRTDPLDFETVLLPLLGLTRSQAYLHLNMLRSAHLMRWSTSRNGAYTFTFNTPDQQTTIQPRQQDQANSGLQSAPVTTHQADGRSALGQDQKSESPGNPDIRTFADLHEEEDEDLLASDRSLHHLHHQIPKKSPENRTFEDSEIYQQAYRAICAGGVWSDEAAQQAQRFAVGSVRLTIRDLLENVAYVHDPESDIDKPGAIMRIHVRAQRKSPRHYPDLPTDFEAALEWATHPEHWDAPISPSPLGDGRGEGWRSTPSFQNGSVVVPPQAGGIQPPAAVDVVERPSLTRLWTAVCDRVIARNPLFFEMCLRHTVALSLHDGTLTLQVPHAAEAALRPSLDKLTAIVADVVEDDVHINLIVI